MPDPDDNALVAALQAIARGRHDNGRPLSTEDARQIARRALTTRGVGWGMNPAGGSRLFGGGPPRGPHDA